MWSEGELVKKSLFGKGYFESEIRRDNVYRDFGLLGVVTFQDGTGLRMCHGVEKRSSDP